MKVKIIYENGETKEIEAKNSFQAHNIMWGSFSMLNEKGRTPVRAICEEADAEFWVGKNNIIQMRATDMEWVNYFNEKIKGG